MDVAIARWLMIRGWDARIQTHPEAEVLNKLKSTPEFLSQALR